MKVVLFLFFFAIIYISITLYLYITQDKKIFNNKFAKPITPTTAQQIFFTTSDGIKLEGAYIENNKNAPLVLYFSGNSNNVIEFLDTVAPKIKEYNFIGFNYPGYANSEGKPCEECILKYALEIYDKYKPDYIAGRSLGSAVASYVAANRDIKGLLLITPIDSITNIAKSRYPFLPIKLLIKHKFEAYKFLRNVFAPVSLLLVKKDDTVPNSSISRVINSIFNLKEIKVIDNVGHGNVYEYPHIHKIIENLLKSLTT